jgi:hypothetical protein
MVGEYPDTMPQALKVADRQERSLSYIPKLTPEGKIAGPNGRPLGANAPAPRRSDEWRPCLYASSLGRRICGRSRSLTEGRSCIYEPIRVNGRAVDSKGST